MINWRDDICCCASQDCPQKEKCVRYIQGCKPGIHTFSDLYQFCKEDNEYFIEEDEV